jgi:pSer/pThr/pTyr-binding forkhead associated (FHA) protein
VHVPGLPPWVDIHPTDGLSVGRAADNNVSLAAGDHAQVSAHHLRFTVPDGELVLTDLGSTNGTFVNGVRVPAQGEGQPVALSSGDRVRFGAVELSFLSATEFRALVQAVAPET